MSENSLKATICTIIGYLIQPLHYTLNDIMQSFPGFHLAQINIAPMIAPMDSPIMAEFVAGLEPMNTLADASEGFVWRLKGDEDNATAIRVFDNDMLIINMSIWESVEDLRHFAYKTAHSDFIKNRKKWFERMATPYLAMWWIKEGEIIHPISAKNRLEYLTKRGDSQVAFTFRTIFEPK
jgi:Domain of unknown function (DUF3291)